MIRLDYPKKKPPSEILNGNVTARFKEIETHGHYQLGGWRNMLILGDNFSALKLLLQNPSIKGRLTLVYIDPPFSTNQVFKLGNDRIATISRSASDIVAYEDTLSGAEYLEFLRERLILLREILANNGSIYVHIDWKIGHYVKLIMDEIFNEKHFINDITRIKSNPKNFPRRTFGDIKDMVLFYSKTGNYIWNEAKEGYTEEEIRRLFSKIDENGRRYTTNPLHAPGETKNGPTGQPWKGIKPPKGRHWRYPPDELTKLDEKGLIERSNTGNPRKKIYADEYIKKKKKRQDIWEFKDPAYPVYPTEKNLDMLKMIIETSSNPGDIVLDCFVGSGTTSVAAEQTGRRWIGIDSSKIAVDVYQRRINKIKNHSAYTLFEITEGDKDE